jgi:muramoyltetrapeptide carboxypeptidase
VVAPASRMSPEVAERVPTLAKSLYPDRAPEIVFHPQCFASHGHFAGDDETRGQAFLDIANDESYDAVWFARGGYGSCRVVEAVMCRLTEPSRRKTYVGYSDAGVLLAVRDHSAWSRGAGHPPRWGRGSGWASARLDGRSVARGVRVHGRPCEDDSSI